MLSNWYFVEIKAVILYFQFNVPEADRIHGKQGDVLGIATYKYGVVPFTSDGAMEMVRWFQH